MKIVVFNLGYNDITIHQLDGMTGSFSKLTKLIKNTIGKNREIESYKIIKRNYKNTGDNLIDIITTEDPERAISIINNGPGGRREGAGRPITGRKKVNFYITDDENEKIKKYLEELRT